METEKEKEGGSTLSSSILIGQDVLIALLSNANPDSDVWLLKKIQGVRANLPHVAAYRSTSLLILSL